MSICENIETLQMALEKISMSAHDPSREVIADIQKQTETLSKTDHEKASELAECTLAISRKLGFEVECAKSLTLIGFSSSQRGDYEKALEYYTRSLLISEKIDDKRRIATTTNNISIIYQKQDEWNKALDYLERSLQSFTELGDDLGIASSCNNMGELHMKRGNFKIAEQYLHRALETAVKVDAKQHVMFSYENLSILHETMGDFQEALRYYTKYSDLNQQVFNEENTKNMIQLQIKFETGNKEKEAEIYKLKNTELRDEISERIHIEEVLRKHQEHLEDLINERTVELKNSYNKLERGFQGSIVLISKITELRDPYTSGHQIRVAKLASAIAKELDLPEEQIEAINIAALVHDVGKINVPQEILSKPGTLSDLEMRMIQIHPEVGYNILSEINFPWPIAEIVREHHEHYDGSGYPQGLKSDNIMIEARIICVADVIEAMSSHRPYRPVLGLEEAVREITENENILYDRKIVKACRKIIFNKGFSFD